MIDFQGFNQNNPSCRKVLSNVSASAEQAQMGLPLDDYVICCNSIPGFALQLKQWFLFDIDLIKEIEFNIAAFENLVLAPEKKKAAFRRNSSSFAVCHP